MCLRPISIDNSNFGARIYGINLLRAGTRKILVPCGNCSACLALKQSFLIQRCQLESFDNDIWFCTLTYNNECLPIKNVNGRKISYADKRDFQCWIKMLRKYDVFNSPFRFLAVSERGKSRHRPHWHVLFFTPKIPNETYAQKLSRETYLSKELLRYWRRNYGSTRIPQWKPLLTYKQLGRKRNYDFHYVSPHSTVAGEQDVAFYVTKYVLKADEYTKKLRSALYFNLDEKDYHDTWLELRNHLLISKNFGDTLNPNVISYVKQCIQRSVDSESYLYPIFINPVTGQEFPLSPYLKKKFLTVSDAYVFYERNGALDYQDVEIDNRDQHDVKERKFARVKSLVNRDVFDSDDDCSDSLYESPAIIVKSIQPYLDFEFNNEFL